jgi:uncharacterized protein with NRDE domain
MCLLIAAHRVHPRYDLAIAANRDERHMRPSAALHFWRDAPGLLAGRDLIAGGTWLGVDGLGRFAAVTNFHEAASSDADAPSRGELVAAYLRGKQDAAGYLEALETRAARYAGFNLLLADRDELWYASNRASQFARALSPGIYGLSNHLLDTPWPKTVRGREAVARWVDAGAAGLEPLRTLLLDAEADAGPFVMGAHFGTRSCTWLARDATLLQLGEQNFAPLGRSSGMAQFSVSLAPVR